MSFGYSEDFVRRSLPAPETNQEPTPADEVIDAAWRQERSVLIERVLTVMYVTWMLTIVVYGLLAGDLDVAILAAGGLASLMVMTLVTRL